MLQSHIDTLSSWLHVAHLESAHSRCLEMREVDRAKDLPAAEGVSTGRVDVKRASFHEAAHAISASVLGLTIHVARVRSDGSGAVHRDSAGEDSASALMTEALIALAGPAFELLAGADSDRQFQLAHGHDVLTARLNIEKFQGLAASWQLSHRTFAQMACCVVAANWPAIARTAQALRVSGELDGAAIAALCRRDQ